MFVPVITRDNIPLMPTTPSRARRWVKSGEATPFFRKGVFCVRLNREPSDRKTQEIAVGVDPGSKWEGMTVKSKVHTFLNVHMDAVTWVKGRMEQRRNARRARRFRKTPCRPNRQNRSRGILVPSTKARWQWKLRVINWLTKIFPIAQFVVEDVKVKLIKGKTGDPKRWNINFSPLMIGKNWFYKELEKIAPVTLRDDTAKLRDFYGLKKTTKKSAKVFNSHCVDSWVLANVWIDGNDKPENIQLLYLTPFEFRRRHLHLFQAAKGGSRRPDGGTRSLGLKRGALIKHTKWGISYVGGHFKNRISLHSLETGKRLTQSARPKDCKVLSMYNTWRAHFLPLQCSSV